MLPFILSAPTLPATETAYVQPVQAPSLAPCLKAETRLAEVANLLTGQQIVAISDGAPCCYRKNGKSYSSIYKNGTCKADTTYLCFKQQMDRLLADYTPPNNGGPARSGGTGTRQS